MSETTPPQSPDDVNSTPAPETASPESAARPRKPRRWRRRIVIALVALLAIGLILRIILYFALPVVINKVAAAFDLNVTFERHELTLLGGDAGLWFVKVTPKSGGVPLLSADYVRGNISPLQLLAGNLVVWRVE